MKKKKNARNVRKLFTNVAGLPAGRRLQDATVERIRVNIGQSALEALIAHAKGGYEVPYKTEVGGHLFGYFSSSDSLIHIAQAVPYHTPCAARTYFAPNFQAFERKGRRLERGRKRWVGVYHSHPETGGRASALPSAEDLKSHRESSIPLELIVRVSPFLMNRPKTSITASCGSYFYDISCFVKDEADRITSAGEILIDEN